MWVDGIDAGGEAIVLISEPLGCETPTRDVSWSALKASFRE